jgi:ferredoxin-thioredoxin reductase catalytic chain
MALSAEAQAIREALDRHLVGKPFRYNPDAETVARILEGLAKRRARFGEAYCPCRIVTGKAENDKRIVCPCAMHEEEIARQGFCHCRLFVAGEGRGA